ncbi:MAG: hypothetical protein ACI4FY_05690 [Acetatifactor sp.]
MVNPFKSYQAFAPFLYRLFICFLFPLSLLVIGAKTFLVIPLILLPTVDVMADYWFLGGIQSKRNSGSTFLMTSARGRRVTQSAVIVDLIRRFLTILIVFAGWLVLRLLWAEKEAVPVEELMLVILLCYTASTAGTVCSRFFGNMWVNVLVAQCVSNGCIFGYMLLLRIPVMLAVDIALGLLSVLVSVWSVKLATKRVKEEYYDTRI